MTSVSDYLISFSVVIAVSLLPITVGAAGLSHCPSKCNCNETAITCTEEMLTGIPNLKRISTNPIIIDLSANDIEEVKATHFFSKRLENVQYLHLNDNSILSIEVSAFTTLPSLQYLDLSNNLLENVPSDMIRKNDKLTELSLSGNLFSSNTPELFSTSLKVLDLSFSKISVFTENNLKGLPNLQALYLHANSLQRLDYNIFDGVKLKYIDLAYNSWNCECDTIKLFDYLVKEELTEIDRPIQCMHPNKWYDDIYDSKGPMHHNKLCNKKLHRGHHTKSVPKFTPEPQEILPVPEVEKHENVDEIEMKKFESTIQNEIMIIMTVVAIGMLLVLTIVTLTLVKKIKASKNPIYEEICNPTCAKV